MDLWYQDTHNQGYDKRQGDYIRMPIKEYIMTKLDLLACLYKYDNVMAKAG